MDLKIGHTTSKSDSVFSSFQDRDPYHLDTLEIIYYEMYWYGFESRAYHIKIYTDVQ